LTLKSAVTSNGAWPPSVATKTPLPARRSSQTKRSGPPSGAAQRTSLNETPRATTAAVTGLVHSP
jgi:hypothetical protein